MNRRGISLLELMVVFAIITILVTMLLPAVQRVREAATYAQCKNHMRQVGVALHLYQNDFQRIPPAFHSQGSLVFPDTDAKVRESYYDNSGKNMFWYLVPYLEGEKSVDRTDPVSIYLCPSRRDTSVGAKTDYGFCFSDIEDGWGDWWGAYQTNRWWVPVINSGSNYRGSDILGVDWKPIVDVPAISEVGIPDGLSCTILLTHKGLDARCYTTLPVPPEDSAWYNASNFEHGHQFDRGWNEGGPKDSGRFPFAFFKDDVNGHYIDYYCSWVMGYYGMAPCYELMTAPHMSMPVLFSDGRVSGMAFSKYPSYRWLWNETHGWYYYISNEVRLLTYLWMKNDGVGVSSTFVDEGNEPNMNLKTVRPGLSS